MATIGVIGLGTMGGAMAAHLARTWDVVGFDRRRAAVEDFEDAGGTGLESAEAVGEAADVVVLSLPGPTAVTAVVEELDGSLEPGSVVVDTTTSTPETTRSIAESLGPDVDVLGAPVSGGAAGAQEGSLTAMVGGEPAVVESCRAYLEAFASNVYYVGEEPGHGHATKLLNNYLSFAAMVATSEAVTLGREAGLDVGTICDVFSQSSGRNSATEDKFPAIEEDRDVGFTLGLMAKDARLLSAFADEHDVALPVAGLVRSEVDRARVHYGEDGDMTDVYDYVRETTIGTDATQ